MTAQSMLVRERDLVRLGVWPVSGTDEVGRGALSGPVVAASVILDPFTVPEGLRDSKTITKKRRESLEREIVDKALAIGVGVVGVDDIDRLNIREATLLAMRLSLRDLRGADGVRVKPAHALVDGEDVPTGLEHPATAVIDGDALIACCAAAAIVAKVRRDAMMAALAEENPGYGFERNAGYGTREHIAALRGIGPCRHHRRGFEPLRSMLRNEAKDRGHETAPPLENHEDSERRGRVVT